MARAHVNRGIEFVVKYMALFRLSDATGLYLSWCPLLDIKSQGRTEEEAKTSLNDAVRLFVRNCYRRGILDEVLLSLGLEPGPDDGDGDDDDGRECISVRPIAERDWEPWIGEVPLSLVAASKLRGLPGAETWPQ